MGYPIEMKEAVIKKVLLSGKTHHEITREAGIGRSRSPLTHWMKHYELDGNMTKKLLVKLSKCARNVITSYLKST